MIAFPAKGTEQFEARIQAVIFYMFLIQIEVVMAKRAGCAKELTRRRLRLKGGNKGYNEGFKDSVSYDLNW